jgi:uncharacterized membrane protein
MAAPFQRVRSFSAAVIALQAGAGLYVLANGPLHPVPMHFDASGEVNRWGGRGEAGALILGMAALSFVGAFGLKALTRRAACAAEAEPATAPARWIVLGVTSAICLFMLGQTFGVVGASAPGMLMAFLSGLFILVGAWVGKVSPNPLVGVRTPWAFGSRQAWDKSNRLAGRLFFWGGLVSLLASPFAPQPIGVQALIAGVLAAAAAATFESWRVWRNDPDRRGAF